MWDETNPNLYREKTLSLGAQWTDTAWFGSITTNQFNKGKIEIDFYQEVNISTGFLEQRSLMPADYGSLLYEENFDSDASIWKLQGESTFRMGH